MKTVCFLIALLSLVSTSANAFYCHENAGKQNIDPGGGSATINVTINPQLTPGGVTTVFDATSDIYCAASSVSDHITDDLYVESVTTSMAPSSSYQHIGNIVGVDYVLPYNGSEIFLFETDSQHAKDIYLPVIFKLKLGDGISDPAVIHKGDILYTLYLRQHSSLDGDHIYSWVFKAANNVYIVTSTCTINNGQQINVDFGSVSSETIGATLSTTLAKITKNIPIHCSNGISANAHMDVYASSFASGFTEVNAIATTSSNLGIVLSKDGQSLPLNKASTVSFPIINGEGDIALDINLIKKTSSVSLSGGAFSASATLVLAAD